MTMRAFIGGTEEADWELRDDADIPDGLSFTDAATLPPGSRPSTTRWSPWPDSPKASAS